MGGTSGPSDKNSTTHTMRSREKFRRYAPLLSLLYVLLLDPAIVTSAPVTVEESAYEVEGGCYYMLDLYKDGEQIRTNEPCLNCTCANSMLMCYLKTCPFSKPIGSECSVERVAGQCCPIIKCPEVPVMIPEVPFMTIGKPETTAVVQVTSTTAVSIPEPEDGCFVDGIFFTEGSQVPQRSDDPCDLCYCIHNHTACVKQRCTLEIPGCLPKYKEGTCCPVSYDCDSSVTFEPSTTTTTLPPSGCYVDDEYYYDGSVVHTGGPCEHCYCMQGKLVCAVQECDPPMEKCTPVFGEDQCCPAKYECPVTPAPVFNSTESYFEETTDASIVDDSTESPVSSVAPEQEVEPKPQNDSVYTTKHVSVFESTTESYLDNEVTDAQPSQRPLDESQTVEPQPTVEKFATESPKPVLTEQQNATELPSEVRQGDSTDNVAGEPLGPTEGPSATLPDATEEKDVVTTEAPKPESSLLDEESTEPSKQATSQKPSEIASTEDDSFATESDVADPTPAAAVYNASGKPAEDEDVATTIISSNEQDDVLTTVPSPAFDDRTTASVGFDASHDKVTAAPDEVLNNETRVESQDTGSEEKDAATESSYDQSANAAKTDEDASPAATKSPDLAPLDEEIPASTPDLDLISTEDHKTGVTESPTVEVDYSVLNESVQTSHEDSSEAAEETSQPSRDSLDNVVPSDAPSPAALDDSESSESPVYDQQPSIAPDPSERPPGEYQTTMQPSEESKQTTQPEEYKPTETPTEQYKPTEHAADEPKPSEQSQQDPEQTEQPAEQYKPTEPPSEEPRPSEQSSQTFKPTEQPLEEPKQTEQPLEEPKQTEQPLEEPKQTEQPLEEPKQTEQPHLEYKPTAQSSEVVKTTEQPSEEPKPTEQSSKGHKSTEQPSEVHKSTEPPSEYKPTEQSAEEPKPTEQSSEVYSTTVQPSKESIPTKKPLYDAKPTEQPLDKSEQTEQTSDAPKSTAQPLDELPMGDQPSESSDSSEEATEQPEEKHKPEAHRTDPPYVKPSEAPVEELQALTEGPTEAPMVQSQAAEATTQATESLSESKEGSEEIESQKLNVSASELKPAATEAPLLDTTAQQEDTGLVTESVPGEGDCNYHHITYHSGQLIPSKDACSENCTCRNSLVKCDKITCEIPAVLRNLSCKEIFEDGQCCPRYICSASSENDKVPPSSDSLVTILPLGTSEKPAADAEPSTSQPAIPQSDDQLATKRPIYEELTTAAASRDSTDSPESTRTEVRTEATVAEEVEVAATTAKADDPEKAHTTPVPSHQGDDAATTISGLKISTEANATEAIASQTTAVPTEIDPVQVTTVQPHVAADAESTEEVSEVSPSRTTVSPSTDEAPLADDGTKLPPVATEQEEESSLGPDVAHDTAATATLPADEPASEEGSTAQPEVKTKEPSSTAKEEEIATATEGLYSAKPQPTEAAVPQAEKVVTTEVPLTTGVQEQTPSVSSLASEDKERQGTFALPEATTQLPLAHDNEVTKQIPEVSTASPLNESKPADEDGSGEPEELTTVYDIAGEYHRATTHLSVSVEVENATHVPEAGSVEYLDATQQPQSSATEQPVADVTQQPQQDATQQPQSDATQQPQADATQQPQVDATQQPEVNATLPPQADVTQEPQADSTQQPQEDATQPSKEYITQKPQADATVPPQDYATQKPQEDASQQPHTNVTEQPKEDTTQQQLEYVTQQQQHTTRQPQDDATEQPQQETTNPSREDVTQQPQEDLTQQPQQDATQKPQEDATQKPQEDATQKPQVDATQQPLEDATEQPLLVSTQKPQPQQQEVGTPLYDVTQQSQAAVTESVSKTSSVPDVPESKTEAAVPDVPQADAGETTPAVNYLDAQGTTLAGTDKTTQAEVQKTTPAVLPADAQEITPSAPVSDAQETTAAAPQVDEQKTTPVVDREDSFETTPAAPHVTKSPLLQSDIYQTTPVVRQSTVTTEKPQPEEIATTQRQPPSDDTMATTAIPDVTLFQLLTTTGYSAPHVTDTLATTAGPLVPQHPAITHKIGEVTVTEVPAQHAQNATAHPEQRPSHSPEPTTVTTVTTALPTVAHDPTTPETQTPGHLPEDGYGPPETLPEVGIPITDANFTLEEGECIYDSRIYASAQQIPRDDPCDFCFCFRGDIICLQQSCPPPIDGCNEEAIPGFCCPRYECPVTARTLNATDTKMPYPVGASRFRTVRALTQDQVVVCEFRHKFYDHGEFIAAASGPCMDCICGEKGAMKCIPKKCQLGPIWQALPGFKKMGKPTATRAARNQF